jgi:hypothetical protein
MRSTLFVVGLGVLGASVLALCLGLQSGGAWRDQIADPDLAWPRQSAWRQVRTLKNRLDKGDTIRPKVLLLLVLTSGGPQAQDRAGCNSAGHSKGVDR